MRFVEFTTGQGDCAETSFVDVDQIFLLRGRADEDVTLAHLHAGETPVVQGNVQAIAAKLQAPAAAWPAMQPMDEAPRDGTAILVASLTGLKLLRWSDRYFEGGQALYSDVHADLLGWWPLPPAPTHTPATV